MDRYQSLRATREWGLAFLVVGAAFITAAKAEDSDDEIAKKLSNPVASLISVPFQSNFDFRMGPLDQGTQYKLNFQPVIPVSLNKDWNLIIRTIVPYISQEDVYKGPLPSYPGLDALLRGVPERTRFVNFTGNQILSDRFTGLSSGERARLRAELSEQTGLTRDDLDRAARKAFDKAAGKRPVDHHQDGLGDITQSFFFSPKEPVHGWILGIGPVFNYPTATDDLLGSEKWSAGPTLLLLNQTGPWTVGVLANQLWSFAGDEERRSVNAAFVQPFLAYQTKTKTTFSLNTESVYDWNQGQWTVPLNLVVSQLVRVGKMPVQLAVGGRYYVDGPSGAPDWGLRFVVTLVLPTGHPAPAPEKTAAK